MVSENPNKDQLENLTSDNPVQFEEEDAFQRYQFSKRIAETIKNRKSNSSLVYGVFGKWGEGKTSVINFIKNEISKDNEKIVQVEFNPWRFSDEATLLTSFFNKLANSIQKTKKGNWFTRIITKHKNENPLKKNVELAGDLLKKYGELATILNTKGIPETIGKALSDVDIDTLKNRIENLLKESDKKIVIYLDDIDRLDKEELHVIFRLVKLTGYFPNTIYILSFDEEMVSKAIGERFGGGGKKAGENFLEKIIQVPLTIPRAQPKALKNYTLSLVDRVMNENEINLDEEEVQRFVYQFSTNILHKVKTPRLAVRYVNTLSFTFPLLMGEANMVDLMLFQAIKIFYPTYYHFVKENGAYFTDPYYNFYRGDMKDNKVQEIKKHFQLFEEKFGKRENEYAKELLSDLFPHLKTAFDNYIYSEENIIGWYNKKRIVSEKYFDRYISYTVIEGDISDIKFQKFLKNVKDKDLKGATEIALGILKVSDSENFIFKLRSKEKEFEWNSSITLCKVISDISGKFSKEKVGRLSFGYDSPFGQAAIFIFQLFKTNKGKEGQFDFAKELISRAESFDFAFEVYHWLGVGEKEEEKVFTQKQYNHLSSLIVKRAVNEAGEKSIFEKYPDKAGYIAYLWSKMDRTEFERTVRGYLEENPENVIKILESHLPVVNSSARPSPFKGDLTKKKFDYLSSLYDIDDIHQSIVNMLPKKELTEEPPYFIERGDNNYSEINMLKQFLLWYKKKDRSKS